MQRQPPRGLTPTRFGRRCAAFNRKAGSASALSYSRSSIRALRVSELAGLERRDVDITERSGRLYVRSEVAKGCKQRFVPVTREAASSSSGTWPRGTTSPPPCSSVSVEQMTPDGIRDVVVRYAGMPPHRLRHTFTYDFIEENNNDLVALAR
jgi:integrase